MRQNFALLILQDSRFFFHGISSMTHRCHAMIMEVIDISNIPWINHRWLSITGHQTWVCPNLSPNADCLYLIQDGRLPPVYFPPLPILKKNQDFFKETQPCFLQTKQILYVFEICYYFIRVLRQIY